LLKRNGLRPGAISIASEELSRDQHWNLKIKGKYPRIIRIGSIDSRPVVTCTTADSSIQRRAKPPAPDYLQWMAHGLRELSWTNSQIGHYLFSIRGVTRGRMNIDAVRAGVAAANRARQTASR